MSVRAVVILLVLAVLAAIAPAQVIGPPTPEQFEQQAVGPQVFDAASSAAESAGMPNPLSVLEGAANVFQTRGGGVGGESGTGDGGGLSAALNVMILLTVITLAPAIMLMTTCFLRIAIVLGLLKQALGAQNLPPAQVTTALAIFMTLLVMSPTLERIYNEAVVPQQRGEVAGTDELWDRAKQPLRDFMFDQIEASGNWSSLYMVLNYRGVDTTEPGTMTRSDVDMVTLVPAYMLSELKIGFVMGFKLYLPFLVIDMVIASVLISMSMMMLPPVLISLPFKLLLFTLVDGWTLIIGSLMDSFVRGNESARLSDQVASGAIDLGRSFMESMPPWLVT